MPYEKLQLGGAQKEILSWANHEFSIEEQNMLRNVSRLPCLFKHVALMPDAHLGKGSMVGSVVATKEAVIPATDINADCCRNHCFLRGNNRSDHASFAQVCVRH